MIFPTDELIFFRGVGIPPTRWSEELYDLKMNFIMTKHRRDFRSLSFTVETIMVNGLESSPNDRMITAISRLVNILYPLVN